MNAVGLVGMAWLVLAQVQGGGKEAAPPAKAEKPGLDVEKLPFNEDTVRKVIDSHLPEIQGCYNEMLAGMDKAKEGLVKVAWDITVEGLVAKARIDRKATTLRDPKLHECVITVITAMTFPKPDDGKVHPIEYPFNLKANVAQKGEGAAPKAESTAPKAGATKKTTTTQKTGTKPKTTTTK